jgi:hypothetical protein
MAGRSVGLGVSLIPDACVATWTLSFLDLGSDLSASFTETQRRRDSTPAERPAASCSATGPPGQGGRVQVRSGAPGQLLPSVTPRGRSQCLPETRRAFGAARSPCLSSRSPPLVSLPRPARPRVAGTEFGGPGCARGHFLAAECILGK